MDDYYELLGVDSDARVDEIRAAYRDKKAAIDTSANDSAKVDVAALNKAWNVLSDPYQRGRYDQQRVDSGEGGGPLIEGDENEEEAAAPARRERVPRSTAANERRRKAREQAKPTITLPPGEHFPIVRQRLIALLIDLGVLIVLFVLSSFVVSPALDKAVHKPIVDKVDQLRTALNKTNDQASALSKTASSVAKAKGSKSAEAVAEKKASDDFSKHQVQDATNAFDNESKKLVPLNTTISAAAMLIGLAYLVIPSARRGATFGKRRQGIRVIHLDGSPLGISGAIRRYGAILLATFLLVFLTPFGALGAALVLFAVTTWTRNPNHQGLQDRLFKTVVVTENPSIPA